jgi:hypothetical protein
MRFSRSAFFGLVIASLSAAASATRGDANQAPEVCISAHVDPAIRWQNVDRFDHDFTNVLGLRLGALLRENDIDEHVGAEPKIQPIRGTHGPNEACSNRAVISVSLAYLVRPDGGPFRSVLRISRGDRIVLAEAAEIDVQSQPGAATINKVQRSILLDVENQAKKIFENIEWN